MGTPTTSAGVALVEWKPYCCQTFVEETAACVRLVLVGGERLKEQGDELCVDDVDQLMFLALVGSTTSHCLAGSWPGRGRAPMFMTSRVAHGRGFDNYGALAKLLHNNLITKDISMKAQQL